MQFFQVAAFCWSAIIAVNLWLVIVRKRLDVDSLQRYYHFVAWSVVAVCVIIPNFTHAYGPASVWCWISKTARGGNALRFVSFFVPFYVAWFLIVVCYIWIGRVSSSSYEHMSEQEKEKSQRQMARLRAYPIIFVVLYIPATINRIYNWASQDDIFALFILQALTAPAVGFVNSLAYGLDMETRNRVANSFIRHGWCSYCLGDVLLDEQIGGNNASGQTRFEDEDVIEDGVIDERGGIRRPSSSPDVPTQLESYEMRSPTRTKSTHNGKFNFDEEEDTVTVDF